eukprot:8076090-Pyramimonas_sp.AAC.1
MSPLKGATTDTVEEVPTADTIEEVQTADTVEEVPKTDTVEGVPCEGGNTEKPVKRRGRPSKNAFTPGSEEGDQKAKTTGGLRGLDLSNLRDTKRRRQDARKGGKAEDSRQSDVNITCEEIVRMGAKRIIVFSGSGMSAASGMSTFSSPGANLARHPAR